MALILPGNVASATASTTFSADNSCRFNDGDSAQLRKTPSSAGNQDRWTFSAWIKRGSLGITGKIFGCKTADPDSYCQLSFRSSDDITFVNHYGGSSAGSFVTNRIFRDTSAWYSIVMIFDSGNSTAGDRMQLWVNGVRETSFASSSDPDADQNGHVNSTNEHLVGGNISSGSYLQFFDGYMSEVVFLDGVAASPVDTLGEFDSDSPTIFKPKDPSGLTFGTNGFYLDFKASGNLGNDANGGTDLTEDNLDATDQATDSPTNNFCTLNPLTKWGGWGSSTGAVVLAQGNCHLDEATHASAVGTMATTNMKFYYEVKINASDFSMGVMGSQPEATSGQAYNDPTAYGYYGESSQSYRITAGAWNTDATFSDTGIYHFAIDPTNNKLWVGKDGTWDGDPAAGSGEIVALGTHEYMPWVHSSGSAGDNSADVNFGGCSAFTVSSANQDANGYGNFEFAVPSGFYSLCSANLAEYG